MNDREFDRTGGDAAGKAVGNPDRHDIKLTIKTWQLPWEAMIDTVCMGSVTVDPELFSQPQADRLREAAAAIEERMDRAYRKSKGISDAIE